MLVHNGALGDIQTHDHQHARPSERYHLIRSLSHRLLARVWCALSAVSASELGVTRHCGMWRKARYAADSELGRLLTQRRKAVGRGYLLHGAGFVLVRPYQFGQRCHLGVQLPYKINALQV